MNQIDALFADYCPRATAPPAGRAAQVAAATLSGTRRARRASTRRGRTIAVAAMSVGAMGMLAAAITVLPRHRTERTAQSVARVAWGMDATIELTPDPGVSAQDMQQRVTQAILNRAARRDAAGIEATPIDDRHMRLHLPGADSRDQIQSFLRFERPQILDRERSVIAEGADLQALASAARRLITPGTKTVFYVQQDGGRGLGLSLAERVSTRRAAERIRAQTGPGRVDILEVPADTSVLTVGTERNLLVRDELAVPSSAIQDVRSEGKRMRLTLDPASATAAGTQVLATVRPATSLREFFGYGSVDASGIATIQTVYEFPTDRYASPDLGGTIRLTGVTTWGSPPPIAGTPFTPPAPDRKRPYSTWNRKLTWTTVYTAGKGPSRVEVIAGHRGRTITAITVRTGMVVTGGSSVGGVGAMCAIGVGAPRVVACGGTESVGPFTKRRVRVSNENYGRVRPGVARIAMVVDGGVTADATIRSGWFYVKATTTVAVPGGRDPRLPLLPPHVDSHLKAWDQAGNEIPITYTWG